MVLCFNFLSSSDNIEIFKISDIISFLNLSIKFLISDKISILSSFDNFVLILKSSSDNIEILLSSDNL